MKIYTRGGDEGETGLFGGGRVPKSHVRVEAYGAVDELNACLGMAVEATEEDGTRERLVTVQRDLFAVGASLSTPGAEDGSARAETPPLPRDRIREMEVWIDDATDRTPTLRNFILPGGSRGGAALHLARTVCRRAERAVVRLRGREGTEEGILPYLNRLSDLLFALARLENHRTGAGDVLWRKEEG